jgi:hypothetical protein
MPSSDGGAMTRHSIGAAHPDAFSKVFSIDDILSGGGYVCVIVSFLEILAHTGIGRCCSSVHAFYVVLVLFCGHCRAVVLLVRSFSQNG